MRTQKVLAAINALSREPFEYGVCDCCRFAWRVACAVSASPPSFPLTYASEEEAAELLAQRSLFDRVSDVLGSAVVVEQTADGDPLYVPRLGGLGVRLGHAVIMKTRRSVMAAPLRWASCGWRIG